MVVSAPVGATVISVEGDGAGDMAAWWQTFAATVDRAAPVSEGKS